MSNNQQQQVCPDGAPPPHQHQQPPQMMMQSQATANSAGVPQPLFDTNNQQQQQRPSTDAAQTNANNNNNIMQQQPRSGNTAPSQSGQNGPQGPPQMSQNGRKKVYQIRGAPFEVDPHYDIIKAIGVGAYGLVCSATDTVNKRYVAIKKMPKLFEDLIDGRRVLRELRILRWLGRHSNILEYYGVSRPRDLSDNERNTFREVYFVTELLDADLSQLLRSRQRLSIDHHAFITFQLLCSLAYIHNANVIHRDLKPSNILVNANCEVRLCDFGLSRANVPFGMMTEVSKSNNNNNQQAGAPAAGVIGGAAVDGDDALSPAVNRQETVKRSNPFGEQGTSSPGATPVAFELTEYVVTRWYRPPELLLGVGYHHAVDLWSIGCILMEVITRRPLFDGKHYMDQLEKIAEIVPMPAPNDVPSMLMRSRNQEPAKCIEKLRRLWEHSAYGRPSQSQPELEQVMERANYPSIVRRLMRYVKLPPDHAQPNMSMAKAIDLIAQLLTFHMGLRPTALQALRHPFLSKYVNDQVIAQKTTFPRQHMEECLRQYRSLPPHQQGGVGAYQAFFSGRNSSGGQAPPFDMWAFDKQPQVHENELRSEFWVDMCMNG